MNHQGKEYAFLDIIKKEKKTRVSVTLAKEKKTLYEKYYRHGNIIMW